LIVDIFEKGYGKDKTYRVYLDGIDLSDMAFYADDKAGIVKCYMRNADGQIIVAKDQQSVITCTVTGNVKIEEEST